MGPSSLVPHGVLLPAFHVGTETLHLDQWWGHPVSLDFHSRDPVDVRRQLEAAGFSVQATMTRAPHAGVEAPTQRTYFLARKA